MFTGVGEPPGYYVLLDIVGRCWAGSDSIATTSGTSIDLTSEALALDVRYQVPVVA